MSASAVKTLVQWKTGTTSHPEVVATELEAAEDRHEFEQQRGELLDTFWGRENLQRTCLKPHPQIS